MIEYKISQKAIFMKEKNEEIGKIPKIKENTNGKKNNSNNFQHINF